MKFIKMQLKMAEDEHKLKMNILNKYYNDISNSQSTQQIVEIENLGSLGQLMTTSDTIFNMTPI